MMNVLHSEHYAAVPWRNGGGSTREVAACRDPARHDDFLWRVSIASVTASGPFSNFPGVDRTIALIEGAGMALHFSGEVVPITATTPPYAFPGEIAVGCTLTDGPTLDLNVMSQRGFFRHRMRRIRFLGWTKIEAIAHETLVVVNSPVELSWRGRASLLPHDTIAGILPGAFLELYADGPAEIFIVELFQS